MMLTVTTMLMMMIFYIPFYVDDGDVYDENTDDAFQKTMNDSE